MRKPNRRLAPQTRSIMQTMERPIHHSPESVGVIGYRLQVTGYGGNE